VTYPKNKSEACRRSAVPIILALSFSVVVVVFGVGLLLRPHKPKRHAVGPGAVRLAPVAPVTADFTPKAFVELAPWFNAGCRTNWMGGDIGRDLSLLPSGTAPFAGVPFQISGVIQLRGAGQRKSASHYPEAVRGIPVRETCQKLHFLQGTCWREPDGTAIGAYYVHYADGSQIEIPIVYGPNVRDWCFYGNLHVEPGVAWASTEGRYRLRLYRSVWENPKPELEVRDLDFVSFGTGSYPFLLAITAE
jgi:hexosaminidase